MTLFQLECFHALANCLNFTKASRSLYITQPSLSRAISSLEDEVGVRFFSRNSRTVSLTPAGKVFFEESARILDAYNVSVNKSKAAEQGNIGRIVIGYLWDTFDTLVVDLINDLTGKYPLISIGLKEFNHSNLMRAFINREVDVIVNVTTSCPDHTKYIILDRLQDCVTVPHSHPLAGREKIRIEELKNEKFVLISRENSFPGYDMILNKTTTAEFSPNIVSEATCMTNLLMMVACNLGVSIIKDNSNRYIARLADGYVRFIPLAEQLDTYLAMMWREDNDNPSLKYLIEVGEKRALIIKPPIPRESEISGI